MPGVRVGEVYIWVSSAVRLIKPDDPSPEMSATPRTALNALQCLPGVNRLSHVPVCE